MQNSQQVLTIVFVLIIGLIGGYMLAEHTGKAEHSHEPVPENAETYVEDGYTHEEEALPQ